MEQSVKKKSAHNIYFGLDQAAGKIRHISEVVSGTKCGCICSACGESLEARKGTIRQHHFAHTSNYECMYACEVAIYRAIADLLLELRYLHLPPVTLSFPTWDDHSDQLKDARKVDLENVSFSCEPLQYPPVLFTTISGKKLRILFEFGSYYSEEDLCIFRNEACNGKYSSLLCHLPSLDNAAFFSPEHLKNLFSSGVKEQKWIRSVLTDIWRDRFLGKAVVPVKQDGEYECPIHIGKYRDRYSARPIDCAHCRFNLAAPPDCLCLAETGIQCYKDFSEEPSVLQERVKKLRKQNDQKIEQQEEWVWQEKAQRKPPYFTTPQPAIPGAYSRRMIQCEYCGQIKPTDEFAEYGGAGRTNKGTCKICARKIT